MDREEYPILILVAIAVIGIGVVTTSKPLAQFFVAGTREFIATTVAAILSAMIFVSAVVVGVVVHFLFAGLGLIPPRSSATIAEVSIKLNYTEQALTDTNCVLDTETIASKIWITQRRIPTYSWA